MDLTDPLTAEFQLLLSCARIRTDPEASQQLPVDLAGPIDWSAFGRAARLHGLLPLAYRMLANASPHVVPPHVLQQFRKSYIQNSQRNLYLTAELLRILKLLETQGISVISYKGPTLAAAMYGDLSMRQFGDIDLIVRPDDLTQLYRILLLQGYRPDLDLKPGMEGALIRAGREMPFHHPDTGVAVELQWLITPSYFSVPLQMERLWDRRRPVQLSGKVVQSLAPEDLLVILCVHGTKHLWERISWIRDIAQIISACPELDWEVVFRHASQLASRRMLGLGIVLAELLIGVRLPDAVARRAKADPVVEQLAEIVYRRLLTSIERVPGIISDPLFHLRARERWADRLRYGAGYLLAPTLGDLVAFQDSAAAFKLAWLFRPFRLAGKYGRTFWKG